MGRPGVLPSGRSVTVIASVNLEEIDPDFLEHLHREAQAEQLELPWE
jgi:hypothetical protein